MYKCMLIEDDLELCTLIKEYLEKYNYTVFEQTDFRNLEEQFDRIKPDFVLLDVN